MKYRNDDTPDLEGPPTRLFAPKPINKAVFPDAAKRQADPKFTLAAPPTINATVFPDAARRQRRDQRRKQSG